MSYYHILVSFLVLTYVAASVSNVVHTRIFGRRLVSNPLHNLDRVVTTLRGGSEEERYSRQVYTLGKRAHGLIRSATIYLDGPLSSGLLYECAKNLALSGIGNIVILKNQPNDELDANYHYKDFDDLGKGYQRAARAELGYGDGVEDDVLLQNYLKKLNPNVHVSVEEMSETGTPGSVLVSVDRPHSTQIRFNKWCRASDMKFVSIETAGLYGKTFCDFGPDFQVFDADGETPFDVPLNKLRMLEKDNGTILVDCIDGERHDVSKGDLIEFRLGTGEVMSNSQCEVLQVNNPTQFIVRFDGNVSDFCDKANREASSFSRLKVSEIIHFAPLEDVLPQAYSDDSLFAICDLDKSFDKVRKGAILSSFQAMSYFIAEHGDHPTTDLVESFSAMAASVLDKEGCNDSAWGTIVQRFAKTCKGKLTPVQAVIGAIGAQEGLKAASGLYNPIRQFLLFDCDELIDNDNVEAPEKDSPGQEYVLGKTLCDVLSEKKVFIVGAGAIGCELLKNLATMGARRLIVTDMDTIEKSNLSRQLLFRDSDIGSFKSVAAQHGIYRFNPQVEMEVYTSKVGDDESGPFDDDFWSEKVDIILNALDNVDARLYVDSQCVAHQKALVDSGTLGSKGNVQVVVPYQSESYGSSVDPPEPAIPVCTLKNFPYLISHTIQWGRDTFDGLFAKRPQQTNELTQLLKENGDHHVARKLIGDLGEETAKEAALALLEDLQVTQSLASHAVREKAIEWASRYAKRLFHDNVKSLLQEHPVDSVDEDGEPFWSGSRRAPKPISFIDCDTSDVQQGKVNDNYLSFVQSCVRLRIEALSPSMKGSDESYVTREEAAMSLKSIEASPTSNDMSLDHLIQESSKLISSSTGNWGQSDFEKDDDSNGHVEFVTAASNLRAMCYGIAPVDAMETRRVAGQIVPAMITTTALVSALSCVELLKLVQMGPLSCHRNAFINLASPFLAFTQPVPADEIEAAGDKTFTLWDRLSIKESRKTAANGGIKMKKLRTKIIKKLGLDESLYRVSSVAFGPFLLFASFMHEGDKDLLRSNIWDVISAALQGDDTEFAGRDRSLIANDTQLPSLGRRRFIDLSCMVEELESGEEFQAPPVRIVRAVLSSDT